MPQHPGLPYLTAALPAILSSENLTAFVRAILNPVDARIPKVDCPRPNAARYAHLQATTGSGPSPSLPRYFFALNLRNCLSLLPQLLGSILEAIRFLGPAHCALSIVEGNSPDGTAEVIAALEPELARLGIQTYFTLHNTIDPLAEGNDRFSSLATLRNLALAPLLRGGAASTGPPSTNTAATHNGDNDDAPTTVLFINDVAICADDILELAHQRARQGADMACALDWTGADPAIFYDVYVARAINGDLFFDVPPDTVSWARAADLFWNEPVARARLARRAPFQVFTCWNGAVAFSARPLLERKVAFRAARADRGECHQGEPQLFCKDLWFHGYGKIMVVPSVNLEYSVERGREIKKLKGFASQAAAEEDDDFRIEWLPPPDLVKCMPTFNDQTWRPWNETLV
ncbi:glycosyltransferase family 69 protein [Thermothielavioides terrestris NRRL 8126]|uniref:Glycosyltransferase family 69 protein n=1 Tax=Thermothielavioides terrestris (strain ATCC 38088 / NRRL 8126) TaxID=578455 RepID=G2RCN5_THETT|nr:glycosyltransferase family 69 protein [Thermothielavioides terrestris NRRL 8126]AEO70631.1 glycosyltransferase family 69 protein [Thermothielavioides terrestris NRRL 8126]